MNTIDIAIGVFWSMSALLFAGLAVALWREARR